MNMDVLLYLGALALLVFIRFFVAVTGRGLGVGGVLLVRALVIFAISAVVWSLMLHLPVGPLFITSVLLEAASHYFLGGAI